MRTVSIVGVGLIGASFALALREAGFSGAILGVSSPASIEAALTRRAIDAGVTLQEAALRSDLLYLSQPIEGILQTLPELAPLVRPGQLVTDAGSTKVAITEAAAACMPPNIFLGGHPMAGKEQRGAQAADAGLFRRRPYILTGAAEIQNPNIPEFRSYLKKIGAQIVEMTAAEHDITVAFTSHLPQLLSTALSATLLRENLPNSTNVFGPGLVDMTRLALSAPEVWLSVLATNKSAIEIALQSFENTLRELRDNLTDSRIQPLFERGNRFAATIRSRQT